MGKTKKEVKEKSKEKLSDSSKVIDKSKSKKKDKKLVETAKAVKSVVLLDKSLEKNSQCPLGYTELQPASSTFSSEKTKDSDIILLQFPNELHIEDFDNIQFSLKEGEHHLKIKDINFDYFVEKYSGPFSMIVDNNANFNITSQKFKWMITIKKTLEVPVIEKIEDFIIKRHPPNQRNNAELKHSIHPIGTQ